MCKPNAEASSLDYAEAPLTFNSVETIPVLNASAPFKTDSGKVFKEDVDIVPTIIDKSLSYISWGADNSMPYHIIDLIESDETLATCQMFNAEVCYGAVKQEVEDFLLDNNSPCRDLAIRMVRITDDDGIRHVQDEYQRLMNTNASKRAQSQVFLNIAEREH